MDSESIRYALLMMYLVLTRATALATGKPVDRLANHLMQEMLDEDTPPHAFDLLEIMARD